MTYQFRPGVRENVYVLVGLAGGTGSGKTFSGMQLATGLAGGHPFAVIDTENRRALHYADQFKFDHANLNAPFRPDAYADAIEAAAKAGYKVILVDSFSHEHAGEGGLLDWHEEEFQRLGGRDAVKMTAWIKPKMSHKAMVNRLLQVNAHLILCFRAEQKVEIIDDPAKPGKKKIVPKRALTGLDGWVPISEKTLPYELTASFLLTADAPGMPKPIKLQEQHKPFFPLDRPIGAKAGEGLAAWAAGGTAKEPEGRTPAAATSGSPTNFEEFTKMCNDAFVSPELRVQVRRELFPGITTPESLTPEDWAAIWNEIRARVEAQTVLT